MPKSKLRKNHKKKINNRKARNAHLKKEQYKASVKRLIDARLAYQKAQEQKEINPVKKMFLTADDEQVS